MDNSVQPWRTKARAEQKQSSVYKKKGDFMWFPFLFYFIRKFFKREIGNRLLAAGSFASSYLILLPVLLFLITAWCTSHLGWFTKFRFWKLFGETKVNWKVSRCLLRNFLWPMVLRAYAKYAHLNFKSSSRPRNPIRSEFCLKKYDKKTTITKS